MSGLPPGFVLDRKNDPLPSGFVLDPKPDTSVSDKARARLAAQGIDPNIPVDAEANRGPGFWTGLGESVGVPTSWSDVGEMGKSVAKTALLGPVGISYDLTKGLVGGSADMLDRADASAQEGDMSGTIGHTLAAAIPVIGPAAQNGIDTIAEGEIGRGAGQLTGLILQALIPSGGKGTAAKLTERAPVQIAKAESKYGSIFTKGAKNADLVDRTVPKMMDRGIRVSDPKVLAEAADLNATNIDVDSLVSQSGPIPVQAMIDEIGKRQLAEFSQVTDPVTGTTQMVPKSPGSIARVESLNEYADILQAHAPQGAIDPVQALELRRLWENEVTGGHHGPSPKDPNRVAANAIRPSLNAIPEVGAANAEKSFQINIQKIAEAAPQSKTLGEVATTAAKDIGYGVGGSIIPLPGAQLLGGAKTLWGVTKLLRDVPKTPLWKSTTAIAKRDFYKALQSKDYVTAAQIGGDIVSGAMIADDYGHKAAVETLKGSIPPGTSPGVQAQIVSTKRAVYVSPDGSEVAIPAGVASSFAYGDMNDTDSPISKWMAAMGKQGKLKPGGSLAFLDQ